jgi:hypothetical protein
MSRFDITQVPSHVFAVLRDVMSVNKYLKLHLVPWSPVRAPRTAVLAVFPDSLLQPGWMKDSQTMNGGNMLQRYIPACKSGCASDTGIGP